MGQFDMIYDAQWRERKELIRRVITEEHDEDEFYLSFSGGKDSTVLSDMIDRAIPNNRIPRVYANTGIEYNAIIKFVKELAEKDDRVVIIKPTTPIKQMLERDGYPFKSKFHSQKVMMYQNSGLETTSVKVYLGLANAKSGAKILGDHSCPKMLRYQFTEDFKIPVSQKCCDRLKKEPIKKWQKENNRPTAIIGIMASEGGEREHAQCFAFKKGKFKAFQPLAPLTKEWEDWYIEKFDVRLCELYYPPYNFIRTGCKGCPFNLRLQQELDTLDAYLPKERAQCERIWGPIYEEYRRIGYRKMRPLDEGRQMSIEELLPEEQ